MSRDIKNREKTHYLSWPTWLEKTAAEAMVFVTCDFLAHPISTLHTNQLWLFQGEKPYSSLDAAYKIKVEGGVRGLYAGFFAGSILSLPGTFAYFRARDTALFYCGDNYFGQTMQGACGVAAGGVFWAPTSRMARLLQISKNSPQQTTLSDELKQMWQKKGWRGFYHGSGLSALSAMAGDALASLLQAQFVKCYPVEQQKKFDVQLKATWLAYGLATVAVSPLDTAVDYACITKTNVPDQRVIIAFKEILERRGIRGLFIALPAAVMHQQVEHTSLAYIEHRKEF